MSNMLHLGILALVAGCGGASTVAHSNRQTFEQLAMQSAASFARIAEVDFFDMSTLPINGNASYRGTIEGNFSEAIQEPVVSLIGSLDLEVDFQANGIQMSGTASSFFDQDGGKIDGTLAISNVDFNAAGDPQIDRTVEANLSGSLTPQSGNPISLDLLLEGDFYGNSDPDYLAGLVFGRVRQGLDAADFRGRFVSKDAR